MLHMCSILPHVQSEQGSTVQPFYSHTRLNILLCDPEFYLGVSVRLEKLRIQALVHQIHPTFLCAHLHFSHLRAPFFLKKESCII